MSDIFLPSGFEWDKGNLDKSLEKHGISPNEAEEAFNNDPLLLNRDLKHSGGEMRYIALGKTDVRKMLFISFTIRKKKVRIISARKMNKKERAIYEKAEKDTRL
jgi:uncharacterized protein